VNESLATPDRVPPSRGVRVPRLRGGAAALLAVAGSLLAAAPALASPGDEITGTVTSAATSLPLAGVEVCAEAEPVEGCSTTNPAGEYAIAELSEGLYTVAFEGFAAEGVEYLTQFYDAKASPAEANLVGVNAEGPTTEIDAALESRPLAGRPAVTAVRPDAGLEAGHTAVSITGTDFAGATAVSFGAAEALHFTIDSATEITAESPPSGGGAVHVTVADAAGTSGTSAADEFSYVAPGPAPTTKSLSVKKGASAGGTGVHLEGTGFIGVTAVLFGTTAANSFRVETASSIVAVSPPGTPGAVPVTVTTPNGTSPASNKIRFTYGAPSISSVSPASGPLAGGTTVTVTGGGFAPGGESGFTLGRVAATDVTCSSSTTCTLVTPAGKKAGTVDVRAEVDGKTSRKNPAGDQFAYALP